MASKKKPRGKAPVAPAVQSNRNQMTTDTHSKHLAAKSLRYSHLLDEMVGCGDMVLLEPLTEENLVENLKLRYNSGEIYVSSSSKIMK